MAKARDTNFVHWLPIQCFSLGWQTVPEVGVVAVTWPISILELPIISLEWPKLQL